MKKLIGRILNFLANFFTINDKKILFQSDRGKVDCNPYAIYRYMKDNSINDYLCMWIVEKNADVSNLKHGEYCYYHTFRAFYHMVTSKYLIRSQSLGGIIKKRKNQVYIQTWHGAGNFKKCELDCLKESERPTETVLHANDWDYLICTDEYNLEVMKSSVNYKKETILIGNLETDFLMNVSEDDILKIKETLGLLNNSKKIIMYAPTFRDTDLGNDGSEINIPIMELGKLDDYIILLRLHPLISERVMNIKLPDNFINASEYSNILDLYLITDILITDYSSIVFPYMLLNKSLILYPYDYDDYVKLRGGFYLDYKKDLPGPICYTESELLKTIKNIKRINDDYYDEVKKFNKKYNHLNDGKVCDRFIKLLRENKFK